MVGLRPVFVSYLIISAAILVLSSEFNATETVDVKRDELLLVHVIFRHGERTTDPSGEIYPNDPYVNETYYPYGIAQLTNEGKRTEFNIGKQLRYRYNYFLGDIYTPDILDARATYYNRTKASLELALAALFPPKGIEAWLPGFMWQPIPYNYWPQDKDGVLEPLHCKMYKAEYMLAQENSLLFRQFHNEIPYISKHTGHQYTSLENLADLYFVLKTEEEYGLKLEKWTTKVYPDLLNKAVINWYYLLDSPNLRHIFPGNLFKKILDNSYSKSKGTLDPQSRKLYLFSGHEIDVAAILIALKQFDDTIPPYGAHVIFELHRVADVYGFKIFYKKHKTDLIRALKIPGCSEFCPLTKFESLLKDYLPHKETCY